MTTFFQKKLEKTIEFTEELEEYIRVYNHCLNNKNASHIIAEESTNRILRFFDTALDQAHNDLLR